MKLTIDIGNSIIGVALFKDKSLVKTFSLETRKGEHYDHYYLTLSNMLLFYDKKINVVQAIIASVVPHLTKVLVEVIENIFSITPFLVEPGLKSGITLKVDHPIEVGADIVACAAGAFTFAEGPFIIVDLGTANKFIYVDKNRVFHGVVISAGLHTSFKALVENADQLLKVPFYFPKKILGKNTRDALASGAMYGLVSEIEGLVNYIENEVGVSTTLYLTGGNANLVKDHVNNRFNFEPNLVHFGLLNIMEKNTYAQS